MLFRSLDAQYAQKLGVNLHELLISQPDTGEQALEIVEMLVKSDAVDVIVVDSDAHSPGELEYVQFGIAVGRRAWLESKDVANTLPVRDLLKLVD